MMSTGLVAEGSRHLLTHKEYVVETMELIVKPMDVDACVEQGTDELGASTLFDLSWVSIFSWLISSHHFLFFD